MQLASRDCTRNTKPSAGRSSTYESDSRFHPASDAGGNTLIATLFALTVMSSMLLVLLFAGENALRFASVARDSTIAFGLAEAGTQEALQRLAMFGAVPGAQDDSGVAAEASAFSNSLNAGLPGGRGTVFYQAAIADSSAYLPILSVAAFGGAQRAVRVLVSATPKNPPGPIVFAAQATFSGDTGSTTGDIYAWSRIWFSSFTQSPLCASGATGLDLIGPQVMAGTTIRSGPGPDARTPCAFLSNFMGTADTECAPEYPWYQSEVAPTDCGDIINRTRDMDGHFLPVNWHPMTPIGMPSEDFDVVMTATWLPVQISRMQATQRGAAVTYKPGGSPGYTPSYWTAIPSTSGKVMLIESAQPFCVSSFFHRVALPFPNIFSLCPPGFRRYGDDLGGMHAMRYLDWGLVMDDLSRGAGRPARRFFQPPLGCPTCRGGNPNGIRYIPPEPPVDVMAHACRQNVPPPGTNVFDQLIMGGPACGGSPVEMIKGGTVVFIGTRTHPESLVIDNAGLPAVKIAGTAPSGAEPCNMNAANWGIILATGDVELQDRFQFSGFIHTPGAIHSRGTVVLHGGFYSGQSLDMSGTTTYCAGSMANLLWSPLYFMFQQVAWQDRPLTAP